METKKVTVYAIRDCNVKNKPYKKGESFECTEKQAKGLAFHKIAGKKAPKKDDSPIDADNLLLQFMSSDDPAKDFTVPQLKAMAKACDVKGAHDLDEAKLIVAINAWLEDPKNRSTK